ncbi:sensor histidine kinase [Microlunatus ginsengisoli]|uniref:Histidine kinase domain-containing protein n=1 Tax=Microlunatus ginsengisoli TaxID=363863 RepID=A0ABP6ZVD6_9ACTN
MADLGALPEDLAVEDHARTPWYATAPGRLFWISLAVVLPVVWTVIALSAGPADSTATYPSTSRNPTEHWGYHGGVPVNANFGQPGLRQTGGPGEPPHDRIVAVSNASGDLVPLEEWVSGRTTGVRAEGEHVDYLVERSDGHLETIAVTLTPYPFLAAAAQNLTTLPLPLCMAAAGAFVFWRRPRDPAAATMLAASTFVAMGSTSFPLGVQVIDLAGGRGVWPHVVGDISNTFAWGSVLLFALLFPSPNPAIMRHRWLIAAPYVAMFALYGVTVLIGMAGATSPLRRLEVLVSVSSTAAKATLPLVAIALLYSYRTTRAREHKLAIQIVLVGLVLTMIAYLLLGQLPNLLVGPALIPWRFQPLALGILLLAVAVAVLRFRLFEIDVMIRRSLLAAAVAGSVALVFLFVAISVGQLLEQVGRAGMIQARVLPVSALVLGGAVGAGLMPLARIMRRKLGKLAYGDRENPFQVVSQLRQMDMYDTTRDTLAGVLSTLSGTLHLCFASIEIDLPDADDITVTIGETTRPPTVVILTAGGEELGRLSLDVAASREPLGARDRRLLDEVAAQVGAVVQSLRLNTELKRSRGRIIAAREEERRRIRRDLHDGLGPSLAAQSMQLEVARDLVRVDPAAADELLGRLLNSTRLEIAEIRRLVDELRPRILDQLGLVSAIRQLTANFDTPGGSSGDGGRLEWSIEADDVEPLPAAVEVAAYRIVAEAVNNVVRHSRGSRCWITLSRSAGMLDVTVADDGVGLPERVAAGVGTSSMRERADEIGGTFEASARAPSGTMIHVRLPLDDREEIRDERPATRADRG